MPWVKQFDVDEGLDTAMQQFWTHGYEATSVQTLGQRMGLNPGSLYAAYGGKRDLFLSALRRYDETMCRDALSDLATLEPKVAIRRVFELFAAPALDGNPSRGCFLTNTALELAAHDPEVRDIVAGSQRAIEGFFKRMIQMGQADGTFHNALRPATAARTLLASLQGLIVLTRSRPERMLLRSIIDDAVRRLE